MRLIIQGEDQRKAKTWIGFAKNKLLQIKSFTPINASIRRSWRPVSDVFVQVQSVNGIDTIWIVTEGGKYKCDFENVDAYPIPHSDFLLRCPVKPKAKDEFLTVGFLSRTNNINDPSMGGDWDNYDWDFGDGETDTGASVFHEYAKAGEYEVSLTVSNGVSNYGIPGTPLADGNFSFGRSRKDPPPIGASNSNAHGYMLADNNPGNFDSARYKCNAEMGLFNIPKYEYESVSAHMQFDLTSVSPLATAELLVQGFSNQYQGMHVPTNGTPYDIPITTGIQSSLGGSMVASPGAPSSFTIDDVSGQIGSVFDVTFSDLSGRAIYPDLMPDVAWPVTWGNVYGWWATDFSVYVSEPTDLLKTTKTIRVYSGRRGRKRTYQAGDSVHT